MNGLIETPPLPPKSPGHRFRSWLREHRARQRFEAWYPTLLGAVVAGGFWIWPPSAQNRTDMLDEVLPILVSAVAILAGFQATAQSVMIALLDSPAVALLKRINHFQRLISYHRDAIVALLLFVLISIVVLSVRAIAADGESVDVWVFAMLLGVLAWAMATTHRIISLTVKVLRIGG